MILTLLILPLIVGSEKCPATEEMSAKGASLISRRTVLNRSGPPMEDDETDRKAALLEEGAPLESPYKFAVIGDGHCVDKSRKRPPHCFATGYTTEAQRKICEDRCIADDGCGAYE